MPASFVVAIAIRVFIDIFGSVNTQRLAGSSRIGLRARTSGPTPRGSAERYATIQVRIPFGVSEVEFVRGT